MSKVEEKPSENQKQLSPAQCLASMKPIPPKYRFLISWNARKRVLRFGCGSREKAVFVCSNRKLENAVGTDNRAAKLPPACVTTFINGGPRVDGKELLARCQGLLSSYLHVRDERLYSLLAIWAIATYVYPIFSHFGYLFMHSKFPRSGKTRAEEILSHLCFEATDPFNAPTVPTIRETAAEGGTVVLDTLERWKGKSPENHNAAMEILDAGFRNGGTVVKMVPSADGKWKKETFPVYAPYVLAAIDKESLTDTALDRSFSIEMHRKPINVKKKKYSSHGCEQECQPLRDDLYRWSLRNASALASTYDSAQLETQVDALELNDRAADIWKPLLAVCQALGSEEAWQALTALAVEMGRDPDAAERERVRAIAQSLRKLVNGSGVATGITSEFVKHLLIDGLEVTEHELHGMLSQWGFFQASVRLEQGPRRAWELQDKRLTEIERENASPYPPTKM